MPWLRAHERKAELSAIEAVVKFRLEYARAGYRTRLNLDNIEQLFSYAVIIDAKKKEKKSIVDNIRLAIAATIDYAGSLTALPSVTADPGTEANLKYIPSYFQRNGDKWVAPSLYHAIAMLHGFDNVSLRTHRLNILSFNYDTIIEDCITKLGLQYTYGLKYWTDRRQSTAKHSQVDQGTDQVFLAKLHGSMNWFYPRKRGENLTVVDSYENVRQLQAVPEIIPPVWNKDANGSLRSVWSKAIACLSTATDITIIGYSFPETDMYVQYLLAAGLANNINLQSISVIDPNATMVADRIRKWVIEDRLPSSTIRTSECDMLQFCSGTAKVWTELGRTAIPLAEARRHYSVNDY